MVVVQSMADLKIETGPKVVTITRLEETAKAMHNHLKAEGGAMRMPFSFMRERWIIEELRLVYSLGQVSASATLKEWQS